MKILVTGGMGFIGQAVIKKLLLADYEQILVLDSLLPKIHGPAAAAGDFGDRRVVFRRGDVSVRSDLEPALADCDQVLHLAAETGTGQSMYEIEQYNRANITGTALLLDILTNREHRVKKVVVASSRAIYGEGKYLCREHGAVYPEPRTAAALARGDFEVKCPACGGAVRMLATTEDSLVHPTSFYGITKQVQESVVMALCGNLGIAPVALRYQNVFGPGQSLQNPYTGILSIFSNLIRAGKSVNIFEDGRESRDFVYIEDVAEATVRALASDRANGEVFNVGSGSPVSVVEVADNLKRLFASRSELVVSGNFRAGDIRHNCADIGKIKAALDFVPRVTFTAGLEQFVAWVARQDIGPDLYEGSLAEMRAKGLYK